MEAFAVGRLNSSVEGRIDDEATTLAPSILAGFLQEELGQAVAARLVGLSDSRQLGRYRRGDGPSPRPLIELRLREAYKVVGIIETSFDRGTAKSWLLGTNARLGDKAPIDLFGAAEVAEQFISIRSAARQFVLSQSTIRDPLADMDAVKAARARPMAERLEVALSWNLVASELRLGLQEQGRGNR